MHLKILLPFQIFADVTGVSRVVVETREGSFGLLPHRLDCVAALAPGILIYNDEGGKEIFVAVDEGVMVKTGSNVLISVRNAVSGTDLNQLHRTVEQEFLKQGDQEQSLHQAMNKMESGLIRRLAVMSHE